MANTDPGPLDAARDPHALDGPETEAYVPENVRNSKVYKENVEGHDHSNDSE